MTQALELTSATDPEDVAARFLTGWRPRVYRLRPGPLHGTRRSFAFAPGLSVQETRLLAGGLRMDGHVGPGVLKIGFVRSKEIRVLGACVKDSVMAVACGGSRLNFSANLPGSLLTLLFDPEAAQRVVPESALAALTQRLDGEGGGARRCSIP